MNKSVFVSFLAAVALCFVCAGCLTAVVVGTGAAVVATTVFNEPKWDHENFAGGFFRAAAPKAGNVAVSPYSAATVLSLTYTGATNNTAAGMATALALENHGADAALVFQRLNRALADAGATGGIKLESSNSIWPKTGLVLNPSFVATAKKGFNCGVYPVMMNEDGRARINKFVLKETSGLVQGIIPPPLTDDCELILVNTLYFKAKWMREFEANNTTERAFHAPDGDVQAKFLSRTGAYKYAACNGYSALYMPYRGGKVEMVVFLPTEDFGMEAFVKELGRDLITRTDAVAAEKQVGVRLPKFSVESSLELKQPLINLGMGLAFSDMAEFPGITTDAPLKIDRVIQKVRVDVDEEGTEAAAATSVMMWAAAMMPLPPQEKFIADRPFFFMIRERTTNVVLFMGRIEKPGLKQNAEDSDGK